jgi:hypothetical protein
VEYDVTVTVGGVSRLVTTLTPGVGLTEAVDYILPADERLRIFGTTSASVKSIRFIYEESGERLVLLATPGDDSKTYAQDDLPGDALIRVEFFAVASPGDADVPLVVRWVQSMDGSTALGNVSVQLDQDAETIDVGTITVNVAVGADPAVDDAQSRTVRVTLTENVPARFFSLSATGTLVEVVTVTGTGPDGLLTGSAAFTGVPRGASSTSLPNDRLTVLVEVLDGSDVDTAFRSTTGTWDAGTARLVNFDLVTAGEPPLTGRTVDFAFVRAPGPVRDLAATVKEPENDVRSGEVRLAWDAPTGTGGGVVEYVVSYQEASAAFVDATSCSPTASTECLVTGLDDGTEYTFRVVARNKDFPGLAAPEVTIVATPRTVPGQPTVVGAAPGDEEVTLTWEAPADGGSTITGYVIEFTNTDDPEDAGVLEVGVALTFTVEGLTNGATYEFRIAAVNAAGRGAFSDPVSTTPAEEDE